MSAMEKNGGCGDFSSVRRNVESGDGLEFGADHSEQGLRRSASFSSLDEFEFRVCVSRTPGGTVKPLDLSPADELFYNGKLLPLELPPRLQLLRNLEKNVISNNTTQNRVQYFHQSCHVENSVTNYSSIQNLYYPPQNIVVCRRTNSSMESRSNVGWDSVNYNRLWSKDSTCSDSSNSTDSSGSSHDSSECNSPPEEVLTNTEDKALVIFHAQPNAQTRARIPNWKKSASKWKDSFWGLKKSSKVGMDDKASQADTPPFSSSSSSYENEEKCRTKGPRFSRDSSSSSNRYHKKYSFSDSDDREKYDSNKGAKEVFQKYIKMIKPLYAKISHKYDPAQFLGQFRMDDCGKPSAVESTIKSSSERMRRRETLSCSSSNNLPLSGNLRIGRKSMASCPNSSRSSPNHSGVLSTPVRPPSCSTTEELQSAIQGAIAHCKKSNAMHSETQNSKNSEVSS